MRPRGRAHSSRERAALAAPYEGKTWKRQGREETRTGSHLHRLPELTGLAETNGGEADDTIAGTETRIHGLILLDRVGQSLSQPG